MRRTIPDAYLALLTKASFRGIIEDHADIDDIYPLQALKPSLEWAKKKRFDLIIDLHQSIRSFFITRLLGVPTVRVPKYRFSRLMSIYLKKRSIFVRRQTSVKDLWVDSVSHKFKDLQIVLETSLGVNKAVAEKVQRQIHLFQEKIKCATYFVVAPGATYAQKCWPFEHYAALIEKISQYAPEVGIVLIGGPGDAVLSEKILGRLNPQVKVVSKVGKYSLSETKALIKQASLVLTNDTGMMHFAEAFNVPLVVFFGPTTRDFGFFPYRETSQVFEIDLACRPCSLHGKKLCKYDDLRCLWKISPDAVFEFLVAKHPALFLSQDKKNGRSSL